jgi:hypothetical protein
MPGRTNYLKTELLPNYGGHDTPVEVLEDSSLTNDGQGVKISILY